MSGRLRVFHTAAVPEYKTHSNPDTLINFHLWWGGLRGRMVAEGIGGVRCSEPCTSLISVESLCLVKGSDCQTYEGTGGKKINCEGWGGVHCGSPRAVFTLRLMRGEVVNLGNKAWGIPCGLRRCSRCMVWGAVSFFFFLFFNIFTSNY